MWKRRSRERGSPRGGPLGLGPPHSFTGQGWTAAGQASPGEAAARRKTGQVTPTPALAPRAAPAELSACAGRGARGAAGSRAGPRAGGAPAGSAHTRLWKPVPGALRSGWRWAGAGDAGASSRPRGPRRVAGTDLPAVSPGRSSTADPRLWSWSPAAAR